MLLGAHTSTQGGLTRAPEHGKELGCDVIQLFTRNQRQWTHKPVTDEEAKAFQAAMKEHGIHAAFAHASYLMNLASPKKEIWDKSLKAITEEAKRCEALGIDRFVFHPGAHLETGIEEGCRRIGDGLRKTLDATQGSRVRILLETMAGQGTTIGDRFQDLARCIEEAGGDDRLGICFDTCHVFASGHDIRTPQGYEQTMQELDSTVGLNRLGAVHLNDSKMELGARRDRHDIIGDGHIGKSGFWPLMRDDRLRRIPMALETPGEDVGYRLGLKRLRGLVRAAQPPA